MKRAKFVKNQGLRKMYLGSQAENFDNLWYNIKKASLFNTCFYSFVFVGPNANEYHNYRYLFLKTNTSICLLFVLVHKWGSKNSIRPCLLHINQSSHLNLLLFFHTVHNLLKWHTNEWCPIFVCFPFVVTQINWWEATTTTGPSTFCN